MKGLRFLLFGVVTLAIFGAGAAALGGTSPTGEADAVNITATEIWEGTVRKVYISKPLTGARGYVVGDYRKGEVRVELKEFPQHEMGYEVFMFDIDVPAYMTALFVEGDPHKGIVENAPPFEDVAGLIKKWHSIGSINVDEHGNGRLEYKGGENLHEMGLNMIMIFGKVTEGKHGGPEEIGNLIVECNGPIVGTKGSEGMTNALKVYGSPYKGKK
ncbi:MAG: hypothetical protein O7H41_18475 [Planctomycetota bacterium]|nr:hypothetical protein [Planctomycetota bacterium]